MMIPDIVPFVMLKLQYIIVARNERYRYSHLLGSAWCDHQIHICGHRHHPGYVWCIETTSSKHVV